MQSLWCIFFATIAAVGAVRLDDDVSLASSTGLQASAEEVPQAAAEEAEECKDKDEVADMCAAWASEGACQSNMVHMHVQCKKTCGVCEGDETQVKIKDFKLEKQKKDLEAAEFIVDKEFAVASTARVDADALSKREHTAIENTVAAEKSYFAACASRKAAAAALPVAEKAEVDASKLAVQVGEDEALARLQEKMAKSDQQGAEEFQKMNNEHVKEMTVDYVDAAELASKNALTYSKQAPEQAPAKERSDNALAVLKEARARAEEKAKVENGLAMLAADAHDEANNAESAAVKIQDFVNGQRVDDRDISAEEKLNSIRGAATASALSSSKYPVGVTKYHSQPKAVPQQ
jgi:hypothetical protein